MSQNRIVPSSAPRTRVRLSGENVAQRYDRPLFSTRRRYSVPRDQIVMEPLPVATRNEPSGENTVAKQTESWGRTTDSASVPAPHRATSHSRTVLSQPVDARVRPSGEKVTVSTSWVWPSNVKPFGDAL